MRTPPGTALPTEKWPLERLSFTEIAGWSSDAHDEALRAFCRSASVLESHLQREGRKPLYGGEWQDWQQPCESSLKAPDARRFFEDEFLPFRVRDTARPQGLFTGYYEPLAEGSLSPGAGYEVPVYSKPADLEFFGLDTEKQLGFRYGRHDRGKPVPYFTRREIEEGALQGLGYELVWLRSWIDAFFIQIQGSGRITLPDGGTLRLAYAAKSGWPYTAIGRVVIERGEIEEKNMSMQALRLWMSKNPEHARQLMWENKSFVFFRPVEVDNEALGAPAAGGVNLTPLRSLAVDRTFWPFGLPVWLSLMSPTGRNQELEPFRRLMIAQDTGSAIKGHARGDVYWGWGEKAALAAGHMACPGDMIVLLPKSLALRLEEQL